jgi:hypothetical protein
MPDLSFHVEGAETVAYAASPLLALKLRVGNAPADEPVHGVMLQCQVRIEAPRRGYAAGEEKALLDLFGERQRWGQTLRSMLWTRATVLVPPFIGGTVVDVELPCTFDFNVASTKYFHALEGGEIPLSLLFSGTVLYPGREGFLQVAQVPWDKEAAFRLPVRVWRETVDRYYPNTAWLCLRRDVVDRLQRYKSENAIPTWEQTVERLLPTPATTEGVSA